LGCPSNFIDNPIVTGYFTVRPKIKGEAKFVNEIDILLITGGLDL